MQRRAKGITWCAGAITRQNRPQVPRSPVASSGLPRGVNACRQLRRDLLLHVVSEHGEDLLYKGVQLLLEQQSWVLGLHLTKHKYDRRQASQHDCLARTVQDPTTKDTKCASAVPHQLAQQGHRHPQQKYDCGQASQHDCLAGKVQSRH